METQTKTAENRTAQTDINQYVDAWQGHVKTLNRMRWNLPSKKDQEKLDRIQEELRELIVVAVKDLQQKREEVN